MSQSKPPRRISILTIILGTIITLILLCLYALLEPYMLRVSKTTISSKDIPESFNGTRVVFVSDIQHGPWFSIQRVTELVTKINALKPDIIFLGGDYVDKDEKYIDPVFKELSKLQAPLGVYAVLGNHDHWEGTVHSQTSMQKAGITYIDNKGLWISKNDERIRVGGVGDLWENIQMIEPTISEASSNDFVILVSHNPDYASKLKTDKIDIMLSGHTHGGQVTLFGIWAPYVPSEFGQKYRTGLIDTGHTKLLVSTGVGTFILPVRFFAPPEINLITLQSSQ